MLGLKSWASLSGSQCPQATRQHPASWSVCCHGATGGHIMGWWECQSNLSALKGEGAASALGHPLPSCSLSLPLYPLIADLVRPLKTPPRCSLHLWLLDRSHHAATCRADWQLNETTSAALLQAPFHGCSLCMTAPLQRPLSLPFPFSFSFCPTAPSTTTAPPFHCLGSRERWCSAK